MHTTTRRELALCRIWYVDLAGYLTLTLKGMCWGWHCGAECGLLCVQVGPVVVEFVYG